MTLLIFVTGKMIITGAKSREEIYDAFEKIWPVLCGKSSCFPWWSRVVWENDLTSVWYRV